jgi:hypothetical protein
MQWSSSASPRLCGEKSLFNKNTKELKIFEPRRREERQEILSLVVFSHQYCLPSLATLAS